MGKEIIVRNLNKRYKLSGRFVKKLTLETLKALKKPVDTNLEIVFLSDPAMRLYNKRYKGSDRFTDVLSFRIEGPELGAGEFLGEILISSDRAKANSKSFNTIFEEELVRYVIHGILHLFGYDDITRPERSRMSEKETEVLKCLCKEQNLSRVLTPR
jgi:probable rRNA maturation factor